MATTTFPFNSLLLCYNCRRMAIAFMRECITPIYGSQRSLNVIFVSCGGCGRLPHVFSPNKSLWKGYVDVKPYTKIIDGLSKKYKCIPVVFKERESFSVARLRFRTVAMIVDHRQVSVPSRYAILDDEEGCGFFSGESALPTMSVTPTIVPQDAYNGSALSSGLSSERSPPPYGSYREYLADKELHPLPSHIA